MNAAAYDYHLQPTSLAIDTGTALNAPATDLDGNPRPSGTGYDIGAYEYQWPAYAPGPAVLPLSASPSLASSASLAGASSLLGMPGEANRSRNNQLVLDLLFQAAPSTEGMTQLQSLFVSTFELASAPTTVLARQLFADELALWQRLATALSSPSQAGPAIADITALAADIRANPFFGTSEG